MNEKFKVGDYVVAVRGLYKNVPSHIKGIEYHDGYDEPFYVLDGLPQECAYTIESNIIYAPENFVADEELYDMWELTEVSPTLSIATSPDHRFRKDKAFVPHFHFYHLPAEHSFKECNDLEYEYGGALSVYKPEYVVHNNHTEILSDEDAEALNNYFQNKDNWKCLLRNVKDGSADLFRFKLMMFHKPPIYSSNMNKVYI